MKIFSKIRTRLIVYTLVLCGALYYISPALAQNGTVPAQNTATVPAKTTENKPAETANLTEKAKPMAQPKSPGLIDLFIAGGWSMWPLLLASVIGMGVAIERTYFFIRTKLIVKGFNQALIDKIEQGGLPEAEKYLEETKDQKISDVLINGLDVSQKDSELFVKGIEREAGEVITLLERGLAILAAVSTIAPLIGFLGTVSGMINAFDAIANADQVNAKVVAAGIKEALITTAAGLIVAIPVMSFHQVLTGKVNGFAADVEEAANRIYKELLKLQAKKA